MDLAHRPLPVDEAPACADADGFVWIIRATCSGADPREAELPDDAVVGAWRELVDAVRDWSRRSGSQGPERPGRFDVSGRRGPSS